MNADKHSPASSARSGLRMSALLQISILPLTVRVDRNFDTNKEVPCRIVKNNQQGLFCFCFFSKIWHLLSEKWYKSTKNAVQIRKK